MRFSHLFAAVSLLAFATPAFAADDYVVMKVNGQDITLSQVQKLLDGLLPPGQAPSFDSLKPEQRDRILHGAMADKLLYGEAVKAGIDKSDKVASQLEEIRKKLVVRTLLDQKSADSISDEDIKKEYDAVVDALKDEKEVRASHILVQSEAEAKDIKKKIEGGKGFDEVARENSKDTGSAKQGGDLGFFTKDKMVKEFADAAFSLKKGEVSAPVKSPFGWHIIKVTDVRKLPAPSLADMKDELKSKLQERKLNDYVAGLVKNADVKMFDAKGKEVPFNKNALTEKNDKADKPAKSDKAN